MNETLLNYRETEKVISFLKNGKVINKYNEMGQINAMYNEVVSKFETYREHFLFEGKDLVRKGNTVFATKESSDNKTHYKVQMLLIGIFYSIAVDNRKSIDIMTREKGVGIDINEFYSMIMNSNGSTQKIFETVEGNRYSHSDKKHVEKALNVLFSTQILYKNEMNRVILSDAGEMLVNEIKESYLRKIDEDAA